MQLNFSRGAFILNAFPVIFSNTCSSRTVLLQESAALYATILMSSRDFCSALLCIFLLSGPCRCPLCQHATTVADTIIVSRYGQYGSVQRRDNANINVTTILRMKEKPPRYPAGDFEPVLCLLRLPCCFRSSYPPLRTMQATQPTSTTAIPFWA